jgi:hypothetical protein
MNSPPSRQLEHEHVDRGQHQQHGLRAEVDIVEVHRSVRDEHQHPGQRRQSEGTPRPLERVRCQSLKRSMGRGHPQQPQIDDDDRAEDQSQPDHVR